MSSIEHRKQLRKLRERDEQFRGDNFQPQITASTPTRSPDVATPNVIVPPEPITPPATPEAREPEMFGRPAVIIPEKAQTLTPNMLREQGKRTAEMLAQLPEAQYKSALQSLESESPALYGVVVDELNNMATMQQSQEGDGYDLSNLTAPQQDAGAIIQTPESMPGE